MMNGSVLVAAMALTTMLLRFLPFLIFRKKTPRFVTYLGNVLPPAIIGMLIIYCLKDVSLAEAPHGLPELIASVCVILLHIWKRNALLSILLGTAIYMLLIQLVF